MIELTIKNLDLLNEPVKSYVENYIQQHIENLKRLFKRYRKTVPLEVIINKKNKGWKIDLYIEMLSDTLYFEESGKEIKSILLTLLKKVKKQVKKQKELERKDYLYKRERYRKKKLTQAAYERLIEYHKKGQQAEFDKELDAIYQDLQLDIRDKYIEKGKSETEAQKIAAKLIKYIKQDVYQTFDTDKDERDEFLASLSDISEYFQTKDNNN